MFVQTGDSNVEVIEVVSEAPSAFHDMLREDTRPLLGFMTEVYPDLPIIRAMYAEPREASVARPGDPKITPFTTPR